jgi:hypothetical protein
VAHCDIFCCDVRQIAALVASFFDLRRDGYAHSVNDLRRSMIWAPFCCCYAEDEEAAAQVCLQLIAGIAWGLSLPPLPLTLWLRPEQKEITNSLLRRNIFRAANGHT